MILNTVLALGLLNLQADPTPYNLSLRIKPGMKFYYDFRMRLDENDESAEIRATQIVRVLKVDAKGVFSLQHELEGARLRQGADEVLMRKSSPVVHLVSSKRETLEVHDVKATRDSWMLAMATMVAVKERVHEGQAWDFSLPASKGGRPMHWNYQALKLEKIAGQPAMCVEYQFAEQLDAKATKAAGKCWISISNGMVLKLEAQITNLPLQANRAKAHLAIEIAKGG